MTRSDRLRWVLPLLIVVATFISCLPVLQNGFVDWDDDKSLITNQHYRGLGWSQLRWMFTTTYMGPYQPLSWASLGADYLLWGMKPFGYHLTSLVIHAVNGVLFYWFTVRLLSLPAPSSQDHLRVRIASGFSALVFAIHPLRVESVAWATERRDVLSGFFILLTLLCYVNASTAEGTARARWLASAVVFYAASLLSKAIGMTLPLVLLVLDVYPLRRVTGRPGERIAAVYREIWWEKTPFVALAVVTAVVALWGQAQAGALRGVGDYGLRLRLAQPFIGLTFYLRKTILPVALSPLYELPADLTISTASLSLSILVVLGLSVVLIWVRNRWPAVLASWVCFVLLLAPVLGIAQTGPQLAADRYSYLPSLSWAALAGGGLLYCWRAGSRRGMGRVAVVCVTAIAGLVPIVLGVLTWRQVQVWYDSETLWRHVLSTTPRSSFALNALGFISLQRGDVAEATRRLENAIEINPGLAEGHYNLGNALYMRGRLDEASRHYQEAVRIRPNYAEAHYNLGLVLARAGHLKEATEHYREAMRLQPEDADAHNSLGEVLSRRGQVDEAIGQYREALRIRPDFAEAQRNLGGALAAKDRPVQAP